MSRKFIHNKLVRDGVLPSMENRGSIVDRKKLDDFDFLKALKKKLIEEVLELDATSDDSKLLEELADTQEILNQILDLKGFSKEQLEAMQQRHIEKGRGGFEKRIFISTVEMQDGDDRIDYYFKNPYKYPEVK